MTTVDKAFRMSHSEMIVNLAEALAVMTVQFRHGLISKEVLDGATKMARVQVKMNSSKYANPNDWDMLLKISEGMSNSQMANERYHCEIYQ